MWLISLRNFTSFGNKTMAQNSQILFKPEPSLKGVSFSPVLCFIFPFQKADPSSKSQLVILIATFSVWSANLCWIHGEADVCDAHCLDLWNFDTCHPGFWESCRKHWLDLTPGINASNIYWVHKQICCKSCVELSCLKASAEINGDATAVCVCLLFFIVCFLVFWFYSVSFFIVSALFLPAFWLHLNSTALEILHYFSPIDRLFTFVVAIVFASVYVLPCIQSQE